MTCELHDSYFRLMKKQTCDFKDRVGDSVDVELLYNSVKTEVKPVTVELETEARSGKKSHIRPKGPLGP